MKRHSIFVVAVRLSALVFLGACTGHPPPASVNKPMSPAEGAGDYKDNPMGPHGGAVVPTDRKEKLAPADCPPKCTDDGWSGCGLKKAKAASCKTCIPRCLHRYTQTEGYYDCDGNLIISVRCAE